MVSATQVSVADASVTPCGPLLTSAAAVVNSSVQAQTPSHTTATPKRAIYSVPGLAGARSDSSQVQPKVQGGYCPGGKPHQWLGLHS